MTHCGYFCDVQREKHRKQMTINLLTEGQNGLYIMRRIFSFHRNYTCSARFRLPFFFFICDNKHTFGKQMPQYLALLLASSIQPADWLDRKLHYRFSLLFLIIFLSIETKRKKILSPVDRNRIRKYTQSFFTFFPLHIFINGTEKKI